MIIIKGNEDELNQFLSDDFFKPLEMGKIYYYHNIPVRIEFEIDPFESFEYKDDSELHLPADVLNFINASHDKCICPSGEN